MRRGLTLVEVLFAAALLAVLAAAAAPLLRTLAAGPGRLAAVAASARLAALSPAELAAAVAGEAPAGWPQDQRLELLVGHTADPELVEAIAEGGLRRVPAPASRWVECRILGADGTILARGPRLVPAPEPVAEDAEPAQPEDAAATEAEE